MANDKAFSVRMGVESYDKLKTLAKKNRRSMSSEVVYIVERFFEAYEDQFGRIASGGISNQQVGNGNLIVNGK